MGIDSLGNDLKFKITEILRAIVELSQITSEEWISLRKVAKAVEGSEEFEPVISAMMEIAKDIGMVVLTTNRKAVKLTEIGYHHLQTETPIPPVESDLEKIAKAVKKYASRLEKHFLSI